MGGAKALIIDGLLLDEERELDLPELCRATGLHAEALLRMVEEGLIEPCGGTPGRWRFPAHELVRLRTAVRLQHDLDLNLAGAALALDLLDELHELRARVRALEMLLDQ